MGKSNKQNKLKARLPRGFVDRPHFNLAQTQHMLATICEVYQRYGFDSLETPMIEYTDALGKFLPDQDRPNAGVFSFQDDDEQWLSLRYDLTAPLARYVAENYDQLAKPYRSYRVGYVFRNEKPGPGRFRQFMQCDADTVGSAEPTSDAEICMMAADCMTHLGIEQGDYLVRVNSRKILDGVMEAAGLNTENDAQRQLSVLRAIDKLDRVGLHGVEALLGEGRMDESGDFTKGAGLSATQIKPLIDFVSAGTNSAQETMQALEKIIGSSEAGKQGVDELTAMGVLFESAGYGADQILIDPSVVRGLEYYTGAVYEVELLFETVNEKGEKAQFGSVAGGGRYDGLVSRFKGQEVPANGFSIGVSRLQSALSALGRTIGDHEEKGPVVVLVMDKDQLPRYQKMVQVLRANSIRAELYLGSSGMRAQMKYADRRNAPCVIIQGEDERANNSVTIKDLIEGKRLSENIADNETWRSSRPAQVVVSEDNMAKAVIEMLVAQEREQG